MLVNGEMRIFNREMLLQVINLDVPFSKIAPKSFAYSYPLFCFAR